MRNTEYARLAFQIRSFAGISTKLMVQDLEDQLAEHLPGVSAPQYGVLRMLSCRPTTIRELSDHMRLAPSTLVPIIDRLESDGLVVRGKDPDDRRRTPLMLTEQARQRLAQIPHMDIHDRVSNALHALGAEKSQQLNQLLQELIQQLAPGQDIVSSVITLSTRAAVPDADVQLDESPAAPETQKNHDL
ncbi:MAG TPA: MarR family transcriptional regulator [Anaerolineae bacterium]|jgi:DNA-binding MarR family transcriptional regulator